MPQEQAAQAADTEASAPTASATLQTSAEATGETGMKKPWYAFRKVSRRRLRRGVRFVSPVLVLAVLALALLVWNLHYGTLRLTVQAQKDKPLLLDLPWSAIVAFIGGLVALHEYNRNYKLKQAQFAQDKQRERRRREEADLAYVQKEAQFKEDQRQKQIQFEEKAQEDRFKDIQDRFANSDPRTRANAALRLAEMARQPHPNAKNNPVCEESYPFFLRAVAPLAIALHMEENASVRAANKEAIISMVSWIKGKERNDPLLRALISKLHDANITTKRTFIKSFAQYYNTQRRDDLDWQLLVMLSPFTANEEAVRRTLLSIKGETSFQSQYQIYQKMDNRSPKDWSGADVSTFMEQLKTDAGRLIDTRDVLAEALRGLSSPELTPDEERWKESYDFPKKFQIPLDGAFLVGADLINARLSGARFVGAYLKGANLAYADLMGTWINTNLYATCLYKATFGNEDGTKFAFILSPSWIQADFTNFVGDSDDELRRLLIQHRGTAADKRRFEAEVRARQAEDNKPSE